MVEIATVRRRTMKIHVTNFFVLASLDGVFQISGARGPEIGEGSVVCGSNFQDAVQSNPIQSNPIHADSLHFDPHPIQPISTRPATNRQFWDWK